MKFLCLVHCAEALLAGLSPAGGAALTDDEALRVAAGIPMARLGSIEVRQVLELNAG
jgi:hypothetical protein